MPSTLRRGVRGESVSRAQELLATHWAISVDGVFGVQTEAAVRCFQREHGLVNDGIIGRYTWAALGAHSGASSSGRGPFRWLLRGLRWRSQRDNVYGPTVSCNVTSLAMVMDWCGVPEPPDLQLEDALSTRLEQPDAWAYFRAAFPALQGYHPRTVHGMLAWLARQYGLEATFSATATWDETIRWARQEGGRPCIQSAFVTASGHVPLLVGETALGDPVFHDPWGDWNRAYGPPRDGAFRIYELNAFLAVRRPFTHRILPAS